MVKNNSIIHSKKIIEISRKYFTGAPTQRIPERIQTLGDIELETKVNIERLSDVETILDNIKMIGFSKVTHRTEWHHFFSNNLIAHNVLILIEGSMEGTHFFGHLFYQRFRPFIIPLSELRRRHFQRSVDSAVVVLVNCFVYGPHQLAQAIKSVRIS